MWVREIQLYVLLEGGRGESPGAASISVMNHQENAGPYGISHLYCQSDSTGRQQ